MLEIYISIFLRILAILIMFGAVIPAQYKEVKIKDDLNRLRSLIFFGLITFSVSSVFLMAIRINSLLGNVYNGLESWALLASSFGDFLTSVLLYIIYSSKYTYTPKGRK